MNAAKGQKAMEDMAAWMRQGFTGFEEMTALFQKTYGLDQVAKESPDYFEMWKKAQGDFKNSLTDYLTLFGVVPRDEHLTLVKKYEELKEKVASQEETIKNFQMLLSQAKTEEVAGQLENLVQKQAEQFQKVMESFGESFKKGSTEPKGKNK
ncbi:MAG: hypothetical protein ABSF52_22565 [Syntrophobacteraceae bacterium]